MNQELGQLGTERQDKLPMFFYASYSRLECVENISKIYGFKQCVHHGESFAHGPTTLVLRALEGKSHHKLVQLVIIIKSIFGPRFTLR